MFTYHGTFHPIIKNIVECPDCRVVDVDVNWTYKGQTQLSFHCNHCHDDFMFGEMLEYERGNTVDWLETVLVIHGHKGCHPALCTWIDEVKSHASKHVRSEKYLIVHYLYVFSRTYFCESLCSLILGMNLIPPYAYLGLISLFIVQPIEEVLCRLNVIRQPRV